ncbi:MAG TPA: sugar-binding protein [Pseudomonas sp.]|nr:sugar-binding protein [Pseudomonas sp.]
MTTSSSIHSNAFNFLSFVTTGVDPRTGQYTCGLTLPDIEGNDLEGPKVPLRLGYNPLNAFDSGFGKGWSLQLTQYDTDSNMVTLASGETFKVTSDSSIDDQLLMREKKLDSFRLHKLAEDRFRVVHKSGLVEELSKIGNHPIALPASMHNPQGHHVLLTYVLFGGARLLKSIANADGSLLLDITRQSASVQVRLHPGTQWESLFSLVLQGSENRVQRIELPTGNLAGWRFGYEVQEGLLCINRIEGPLGGHQEVVYDSQPHLFPGDDNRRLPRVARHRHFPGPDQLPIETRYQYSSNNFLGRNAPNLTWEDNGEDNLYKVLSDYRYESTEQLWDVVGNSAKRSIRRVFNRFHLTVEESTEQGDCRQRVETEYHIVEGATFEQQPPQCQLPRTVTNAWYRQSESGRERKDVVQHGYDVYGNQTLLVQANGISEASEYYEAEGEEGCPADPHGFTRHLKSKTVTPADADFGDAPVLRHDYRYILLPPLTGASQHWIAREEETLTQLGDEGDEDDVPLQSTFQVYVDQPDDGFQHGRLARTEVQLNGKVTYTAFTYDKVQARHAGETVLRTTEVLGTDFDQARKTVIRERSLLNGKPLLELDDNDVEIAYRYDKLGRVVEEIVAPGSDFEAIRSYDYVLVAVLGNQPSQTAIDVKQVATRSVLDALQQVVFEERQDVDADPVLKPFRPTRRARYDAFGQLSESDEIDWFGEEERVLTSSYTYDDWGEQDSVTGPDGVTEYRLNDPVGLEVQTWRTGLGRTVTRNNRFDKPDSIERIDLAGQQVSLYEYFYDGLGRTHHEYDELQHFRFYQYDAFDRMVLSGLPDNSLVERRYAEHSREDLPVWIAVSNDDEELFDVVLGEQAFDGLERLSRSVTGGRERVFHFDDGEPRPSSVTTSSGQVIEYDYNLHVGEEPVQRRLPDATADYHYDPHNARLTYSKENGQSLTCTYFSSGELHSETRDDGERSWTMGYEYSLRGRLLGYNDAFGQEQRYGYDDGGRLESIQLGATSTTLRYNASGQVTRILTEDEDEGHSVQIDLEHDDFDREILRTFTFEDGSVQTLEQVWNARDMLERRLLSHGVTELRDEQYVYDARGRLTEYYCGGSEPPLDPYGKMIAEQHFTFDALDNLLEVITRFPDGGENVASHEYGYEDPTQLSAVRNSHADYPALITLVYDDDGNLLNDDQGRTLAYDALGRLVSVSEDGQAPLEYRYDAQDILSGSQGEEGAEQRFYRAGELVNQLQGGVQRTFVRADGHVLAERVVTVPGPEKSASN